MKHIPDAVDVPHRRANDAEAGDPREKSIRERQMHIVQGRLGNLPYKAPPPRPPHHIHDYWSENARTLFILNIVYATSGDPVMDGTRALRLRISFLHRALDLQRTVSGIIGQKVRLLYPSDEFKLMQPTDHVASAFVNIESRNLQVVLIAEAEETRIYSI